MIYTSYFANLSKLPEDIVPIAICGKPISGWTGATYKKLAPKWGFFSIWKINHDNDFYTQCYNNEVLSKLNPKTVVDELKSLSDGRDFALICYEAPDKFCHRHIVAEWLQASGYDVEEWQKCRDQGD